MKNGGNKEKDGNECGTGERILVVDDEAVVRESLRDWLVDSGYDVVIAENGPQALKVLEKALENVRPLLETKSRRVGGANYQVPVEVSPTRSFSLGVRWMLHYAKERSGKSMEEKLSAEIVDAINNRGGAVKKREDTHKMAESNRAFAHYKW